MIKKEQNEEHAMTFWRPDGCDRSILSPLSRSSAVFLVQFDSSFVQIWASKHVEVKDEKERIVVPLSENGLRKKKVSRMTSTPSPTSIHCIHIQWQCIRNPKLERLIRRCSVHHLQPYSCTSPCSLVPRSVPVHL